ncbi:YraN family protein [Salinivibrio socompensis]|uniref:YraN family protein n=1 Tax=Salinivibrio socompensis TaxID=1510206 RepID=UPI0023E3DFB0|nr:YraN family protein [Salinivibrio socompensis]
MKQPQPRATGQAYEAHACQYLMRHGLIVLDKNAHSRRGEIDLVMRDWPLA